MFCPTIFDSVDQINDYREGVENALSRSDQFNLGYRSEDEVARDCFVPPFNLSHHGQDNRYLMEAYAKLFGRLIQRRTPMPKEGRPRIGFLVTAPHEGGFLRSVGGIIKHLNQKQFETLVFCPSRSLARCQRSIAREDISWVPLPYRFSDAAQRVADAQCELLYYRKVGSDVLSYLLPMARLAPVQCTSWGTHLTSGISEIDYYVSSGLIEVEEADHQYTEFLVKLDTLPEYEPTPQAFPPASRSDFGLPERGNLYLCPQRMAKFHPDTDDLFRQILAQDSNGYLVLLDPGRRKRIFQKLLDRLHRNLGNVSERLIVLPAQTPKNLLRLFSVGDALLDLPIYGACLMGYDAFSVDLPVVTMAGRLNVQRYGLAFYRRMGLEDLVAGNSDEYVNLALRLGKDREYCDHVRGRIKTAKHVLFDNLSIVRANEQFFQKAIEKARSSR